MAPLPSNLTHRVWFDYETSTDGIEHTVMVRVNATNPAPGDAARAAFAAVLNAFGAAQFRSGWRVVRSRIALANSDIALPTPIGTALAGFTGSSTGAYPPSREAVEGRFVGRGTTSGRRVSFSLYGWAAGVDISNFRVVSGPAPAFAVLVQTAVNGLNALGNGAFTDVSNDQVLWYPYLNLQYNSYWEGRIRLS